MRAAPRLKPGTERWAVKTGTDPQASSVSLSSTVSTTIGDLRALAPPPVLPPHRIAPVETTVYVVQATLTGHKLEADGDFHLVLSDDGGQTMIAEIPNPDPAFVGPSSPFLAQITQARAMFQGAVPVVWPSLRRCSIAVEVTGVGFFDRVHGQDGVAPNGVELHPVLSIQLL